MVQTDLWVCPSRRRSPPGTSLYGSRQRSTPASQPPGHWPPDPSWKRAWKAPPGGTDRPASPEERSREPRSGRRPTTSGLKRERGDWNQLVKSRVWHLLKAARKSQDVLTGTVRVFLHISVGWRRSRRRARRWPAASFGTVHPSVRDPAHLLEDWADESNATSSAAVHLVAMTQFLFIPIFVAGGEVVGAHAS